MGFMENLKETYYNGENNMIRTENGALGYRSTGKHLLDLNFQVSSLRSKASEEIIDLFKDAFYDDKLMAIKFLAFMRDIRGGLGERRSFRVILNDLAEEEPKIATALIPLVAEYGRFDDLYVLFDTNVEDAVLNYIGHTLSMDKLNYKNNKPVSLLAKWLPSENASSRKTKKNATKIRKFLGMSSKAYRKMLSELRGYIRVVEKQMSAKQWKEINYEAVPSKANILYGDAFMRHDEERRTEFLESLKAGNAKINASAVFPHEIVHSYYKGYSWSRNDFVKSYDETLEQMWKALPDLVDGNGNTLVVRDGSGSMETRVDMKSSVTALDVATAMAVYFSERCGGEYKDKFITFSNRPKYVDLSGCKTLRDKLQRAYKEAECFNTDIEKTFDLVLKTAVDHNLKQEEIPNILIISDMEFDYATTAYGRHETLFKTIGRKFDEHGYKLPRLIFWNVNSRTGTIPVKENSLGVTLVSGFSVNVCKMVLSGELDPYKCLVDQLNAPRYAPVEEAVKGLI